MTWRAFSRDPLEERTAAFQVESPLADLDLCEALFAATNLYQGPLWDLLEPALPADRTHTSLSVGLDGRGDYVAIDGTTYEVAVAGFRVCGDPR